MPRKLGVSGLLSQDAPEGSVNTTTLPPVTLSTPLRAVPYAFIEALDVTLAKDITGSYGHHAPTMDQGVVKLCQMVYGDPLMRRKVRINETGMSGIVKSTGFFLVEELKPLGLPAGGYSPQAEYLTELIRVRKEHGIENAVKVDIVFGDGVNSVERGTESSKSVETALEEYRQYQKDAGVHTFAVSLKDGKTTINYDLMKQLSVHHDLYDEGVEDIDKVFEQILILVKSAARDATSLGRTRSLSTAELQAWIDSVPEYLKQDIVLPGYVPKPGDKIFGFGAPGSAGGQ